MLFDVLEVVEGLGEVAHEDLVAIVQRELAFELHKHIPQVVARAGANCEN